MMKEKIGQLLKSIAVSFYPNPKVEPSNTQMAIGCTTNINDSAIAGK